MTNDCPGCGQQNRVPRKRWALRDRYLAIPILLLSYPIHWSLNHDWTPLWDSVLDWLALISVNVTIITAISLSWLIVAFSLKVSWEEWWATKQQKHRNPPMDEPPLIDLGAWEAARDYIDLAHHKVSELFASRKRDNQ